MSDRPAYKLVGGRTLAEVEAIVNAFAGVGYECLGQPFQAELTGADGMGVSLLVQAMTLPKELRGTAAKTATPESKGDEP